MNPIACRLFVVCATCLKAPAWYDAAPPTAMGLLVTHGSVEEVLLSAPQCDFYM